VSVLVIDWTTTGAPPPIWMSRTLTALVGRFIKQPAKAGTQN